MNVGCSVDVLDDVHQGSDARASDLLLVTLDALEQCDSLRFRFCFRVRQGVQDSRVELAVNLLVALQELVDAVRVQGVLLEMFKNFFEALR